MDFYLEISIKKETSDSNRVLSELVSALHKTLFDIQASDVGISFPECDQHTLGKKLRLHGTQSRLLQFQRGDWIGDYVSVDVEIKDVMPVPVDTLHRCFFRKQPTKSKAKLRRALKRGYFNPDHAQHYRQKMMNQGFNSGFLMLKSSSNGQIHRRYVVMGELEKVAVSGEFDAFGLSRTATVPWF
jgi:CRISPR-associated endonuclease Csy4